MAAKGLAGFIPCRPSDMEQCALGNGLAWLAADLFLIVLYVMKRLRRLFQEEKIR